MTDQNATTQQQQCLNHCSQSDGKELCRTCPFINDTTSLVESQRDAEREDEAWEIQQTLNNCRSNQLIKDLEQSIETSKELTSTDLDVSANRADVLVAAWFAVGILVAVMAVIGSGS